MLCARMPRTGRRTQSAQLLRSSGGVSANAALCSGGIGGIRLACPRRARLNSVNSEFA
jgi:hypothetical protein